MTDTASLESLEELMARQRAERSFTADDVDDALVERLLRAATRAPSAKNVQCLRFVVVRDTGLKRQIVSLFEEPPAPGGGPARSTWADVPVLIFACSDDPFGRSETGMAALAGSVYPGIQNLLLAAKAAGLGTVLTTSRGKLKENELKALLQIPAEVAIHAIIPVGWPAEKLGKNKRRPVREVAYRERFGNPW